MLPRVSLDYKKPNKIYCNTQVPGSYIITPGAWMHLGRKSLEASSQNTPPQQRQPPPPSCTSGANYPSTPATWGIDQSTESSFHVLKPFSRFHMCARFKNISHWSFCGRSSRREPRLGVNPVRIDEQPPATTTWLYKWFPNSSPHASRPENQPICHVSKLQALQLPRRVQLKD